MLERDLAWPFFDDEHRRFAREFSAWWASLNHQAEHERDIDAYCRQIVAQLGAAGWLRACVTSAHGGMRTALDVRTLALARECAAYHDPLGDFAFAMQGLGSGAISLFGSDPQCERYLPGVAAGKLLAAFALSEREAGSDVAAVATAARLEGDHYVLDGEKTWISNAGIADFYVVFARTSADGARGLSAFILDATTPGCVVTERIATIAPHPLGTLRFENCLVPATQRIGGEGDGFRIAMATLDIFRSTVGAAALGMARRALDETLDHVRERKLFGAPLADLQMTQASIAHMATEIDASALLVYRAAWTKDTGAARVTREAAMAKWYATECAGRICDRAVQLFGGRGVTQGELVERLYRDVRALRIYEGASEIQQLVIARATLAERVL